MTITNSFYINYSKEIQDYNESSYITEKKFSVLFQELDSQGISYQERDEICNRITKGQEIAKRVLNPHVKHLPECSKESALALTWFLMASAFQEGKDIYVRGTARFTLKSKESAALKKFLDSCPEAHNRPSSHFQDMKIGHDKGIDFDKGFLPFDKELSTLLFNRLEDGSFYIKLEREPLSITKPMKSIRHMKNWLLHSKTGGAKQVHGKPSRRETDGQEEVRTAFIKVMTDWSQLTGRKINLKKELQTHSRIFQMNQRVMVITRSIFNKKDSQALTQLKRSIKEFKKTISHIPQPTVISGREILVNLHRYL